MKSIKAVQLITGLDIGGAEKVVYDLSLELNKRAHQTFVVVISDKDFLSKMFIDSGINLEILRVDKQLSSFFRGLFRLKEIIKQNEIKVVHTHLPHALMMAACLKVILPSIKIVYTAHCFDVGSGFRERIICLLKPFRNYDIVFSEKMASKMYKKNAVVIPNGITTSLYKMDIQKNPVFTFLCIGRIEAVKNHIALVDIAAKLKSEFEFEIHIAGDGILKEEMIAYAEKKNVLANFKFLGYRKDINIICNQSHVFLLPSLTEGLPLSLLEAGSASLPVIFTPVGSLPELIDENSGYMRDISGFEDAMREVYFNYDKATQKGRNLQQKIEAEYDLNHVVDEHIKIYESLIR